MNIEKLIELSKKPTPSRSKIKDALVEIPDDVLLKIVSDYNEANGLAPIYKATEENINKLKEEGKEVPSNAEDNFAFLTPNSYGGTEAFNNLQEKIDYDTELVPFIESNFTTYEKDIPIQDKVEEGIYNEEWLKKNWKKFKSAKVDRYNNILQLAVKVKEGDFELYKKILAIAKKYKDDPDVYTYNMAKKELFKIFKENITEEKNESYSEQSKADLWEKAIKRYNERYGKEIYSRKDLPEAWKKRLKPLIETGREKAFAKALSDLSDTEEEKNEKEGKTVETLLKRFEEIYGFSFMDNTIKDFASKNDIKAEDFLDCFKTTLEKFKSGEITFNQALDFFKRSRDYPTQYLKASKEWYNQHKTEEEKKKERFEKEERSRETDLETESGNTDLDSMKKKITELAEEILESEDEKWITYWKEQLEAYKESYKNKERDLESYLTNVLYLAKYCIGKIQGKTFSPGSDDYKKAEALAKEISEELYNIDVAQEGFERFWKEFKRNVKSKKQISFLEKMLKIISNDEHGILSDLSAITEEEKVKNFFKEASEGADIQSSLKKAIGA